MGFLVIGEEGVDLLVGVLLDGAAGAVVGTAVAGGVILYAVHGHVAVDEDDLKLKDLILVKVEMFFQLPELADGSFGSGVPLGVYKGLQAQGGKDEQHESLH